MWVLHKTYMQQVFFSVMSIFFDSYFGKRLYAIGPISNLDAELHIYAKVLKYHRRFYQLPIQSVPIKLSAISEKALRHFTYTTFSMGSMNRTHVA